jgi:hypothetical protein
MPLDKNLIPISFAQGIDQRTDPKQVVAGKLSVLENGTFNELMELRKRNGFDPISSTIITGGSISTGTGVYAYEDELLRSTGSQLYAYSPEYSTNVTKGTYVTNDVTFNSVSTDVKDEYGAQLAYHTAGYKLVTWRSEREYQSSGKSNYKILDATDGTTIVEGLLDIGYIGSNIHPVALGNYFVIFANNAAGNIQYQSINVVSGLNTISSPTAFATSTGAYGGVQDAFVNNNVAYVLYASAAANSLSAITLSSTLVAGTPVVITGTDLTPYASGAADASGNIWIAFWDDTNNKVQYTIRNSTLASQVLARTDVKTGGISTGLTLVCDGTNAHLFFDWNTTTLGIYYALLPLAGSPAAATQITNQTATLAGKAILRSGVPYVLAHYDLYVALAGAGFNTATSLQPTDFLINNTAKVAAKILPSKAYHGLQYGVGTTDYYGNSLTNILLTSSNKYEFATGFITNGLPNYTDASGVTYQRSELGLTSIGISGVEFDVPSTSTSLANTLNLSGGFVSSYDGSIVAEQGFHLYPENVDVNVGGSGSADLPAGTYLVSVVWAWIDEKGQIQRSAPSIAQSVTIMAGQYIAATVKPLTFTSKTAANTPVSIELYATQANGTVLFFMNYSNISTVVYNDPLAATQVFEIYQVAQYTERLLYTTGGVVENIAAPATKLMTSYKNRLITVPSESPLTWWYSKQVIPGQPVEFSDLFVNNIDQRGGNISAIGAMDDKIIFFKPSSIFYVAGDGPADTGVNNTFTEAQLVTSDTGCTEHKSVVTTPEGLMYKSAKGIYLLRRDLGVEFIGSDVVDYNSSEVTSAQLLAKTNRVIFTLDSGVFLAYDYYVKQWSVYTPLSAVDSCIHNQNLYFIGSDGVVHAQTTGHTDNGEFIRMKIVTSWLSFAKLQGFQRVYKFLILGEYESPHTLNVSLAYEFDDTNTQQVDIPVLTEVTPYQFRVFPQIQKCETMRITIQDSQDSAMGEGYAISALMLEVGAKQGTYKLPASRSYG